VNVFGIWKAELSTTCEFDQHVAAVAEEVAVEMVKRILVEQGRQPMHPNPM
jgi:ribosomal protein L20A (L18A)